jgi:reverse transcriptase-like protein
MRGTGTERPVGAEKSGRPDGAKGSRHPACRGGQPREREELSSQAKPFSISKQVVVKAYQRVKANGGAAGVDAQGIEAFERDLKDNLYKIWNRMSSGTYFPPPVRSVGIPKKDGGERRLGIPTVADRVAQTVVKMYLEPAVEPYFHPNSYGYRPRKSAADALAMARQRCWRYDWAIDLDIRGFFDNLDHALVMRAVGRYTQCRWILLYVQRWLEAPMQLEDGTLVPRTKGTPQGGVVTPPTQSQTLPGTEPCPTRGWCTKNLDGNDIGHSTFMTHERSAARPSGPVRRARESSAQPVRASFAPGGSADAGPPISRLSAPGPAVCRRGRAASPGITRAGADGGVHGEAAGQSGAPTTGTGPEHWREPQFTRHAWARRLAASGAAWTRRWRIGASSTTTCLTAWAMSG